MAVYYQCDRCGRRCGSPLDLQALRSGALDEHGSTLTIAELCENCLASVRDYCRRLPEPAMVPK